MKFIDISGNVYVNLTVLSFDKKIKGKFSWICQCKCGNIRSYDGESLKRGFTKSCGCLVKDRAIDLRKKIKERLLSRIIIENDCWVWQGPKDKNGYGNCGKTFNDQRAHRASYKEFKGDIPNGYLICHHCDNPPCINPDHLYIGTVKDNVRDALERGLHPKGPNKKKGFPGSLNSKAKINEDDVFHIRNSVSSSKELSNKYNLHIQTIQNIRTGKTWKCVS